MARYRKKPVIIEARKLIDDRKVAEDLSIWCAGMLRFSYREGIIISHVMINTLEGVMQADPGDWIIRGIKGEFYPCKPDIFEQTYELVEDQGGN